MDNVLSESQKFKAIAWNDLLKMEHLFDSPESTDFTRSLYSVFTKIAPRRPKDYRIMRVIIKKNKKDTVDITKLDSKYNFIICSEKSLPTRLVFNTYKTSTQKGYGQYVLDKIPVKLANILQKYIVNSSLKTGNFLFHQGSDKNTMYAQGNFSNLISDQIFKVFFGRKIDVNAIRHSYASFIIKKNMSQNQLAVIAHQMGTSVSELLKTYNKIDIETNVLEDGSDEDD